jgi:hypothetical protein
VADQPQLAAEADLGAGDHVAGQRHAGVGRRQGQAHAEVASRLTQAEPPDHGRVDVAVTEG